MRVRGKKKRRLEKRMRKEGIKEREEEGGGKKAKGIHVKDVTTYSLYVKSKRAGGKKF